MLSKKQQKKQNRLLLQKKQQANQLDEQLSLEVGTQASLEPTYEDNREPEEPQKPSFLTLAQKLVEISFACANVPENFSSETLHEWGEQLAQVAFLLHESSQLWQERLQTPNEKELRKKLHERGKQLKEIQHDTLRRQHYRNAVHFSNMLYQVADVFFTLQAESPFNTVDSIPRCLPNEKKQVWEAFQSFYTQVKPRLMENSSQNPTQSEQHDSSPSAEDELQPQTQLQTETSSDQNHP